MVFGLGKNPKKIKAANRFKRMYNEELEKEKQTIEGMQDDRMREKAREKARYDMLSKEQKFAVRMKQVSKGVAKVTKGVNQVSKVAQGMTPESKNPFGNVDYNHMFHPDAVFGKKDAKKKDNQWERFFG